MPLLEIKKYPHPILRKKCSPVQILRSKTWSGKEIIKITEEIKKLAQNMVETMVANQGVGLAASQVGESKRIIVVHPIEERTIKEKSKIKPQIFINPKIIKKSKKTIVAEEGCLSFPGLFLKIKRAKEVEVSALNERGEEVQIRAEGLLSRIFQHEIDHLDGILFIDHVRVGRRIWELLKFYFRGKK